MHTEREMASVKKSNLCPSSSLVAPAKHGEGSRQKSMIPTCCALRGRARSRAVGTSRRGEMRNTEAGFHATQQASVPARRCRLYSGVGALKFPTTTLLRTPSDSFVHPSRAPRPKGTGHCRPFRAESQVRGNPSCTRNLSIAWP